MRGPTVKSYDPVSISDAENGENFRHFTANLCPVITLSGAWGFRWSHK